MNTRLLERLARGDTIAAPATLVGTGALAVIRVSGPDSLALFQEHFQTLDERTLPQPEPRRVYAGWWMAGHERLDQVAAVYYAAPHSYTGEAMLEVTCHGGRAPVAAVLHSLVESGARLAEPGEFTLRAFAAGKLDLAEAEAVETLVGARNDRARALAVRQLSGDLSRRLSAMRASLADAAIEVESALEFPEEALGTGERARLGEMLGEAASHAQKLRQAAEREMLYQRGHTVVLLGRPNVGKSTLLNAILGRERALVSSIAGTTRDLLVEELLVEGHIFKLIDGAGLHETDDPVEQLGIERLRAEAAQAWAWLVLIEAGSRERMEREAEALLRLLPESRAVRLLVLTKSDLAAHAGPAEVGPAVSRSAFHTTHAVAALHGEGIVELLAALAEAAGSEPPPAAEDAFLLSGRQRDALARLERTLAAARSGLQEGTTLDMLAEELRAAHTILGELLGEDAQPDLLDAIFSRFCIGK